MGLPRLLVLTAILFIVSTSAKQTSKPPPETTLTFSKTTKIAAPDKKLESKKGQSVQRGAFFQKPKEEIKSIRESVDLPFNESSFHLLDSPIEDFLRDKERYGQTETKKPTKPPNAWKWPTTIACPTTKEEKRESPAITTTRSNGFMEHAVPNVQLYQHMPKFELENPELMLLFSHTPKTASPKIAYIPQHVFQQEPDNNKQTGFFPSTTVTSTVPPTTTTTTSTGLTSTVATSSTQQARRNPWKKVPLLRPMWGPRIARRHRQRPGKRTRKRRHDKPLDKARHLDHLVPRKKKRGRAKF